MSENRPVVLIVLDGWGLGPAYPGNAIALAETPIMDRLCRDYPFTTLSASGRAVGLPEGQIGNSEVGHLNIGAGFIVRQWITKIDDAIADGSFATNLAITTAIDHSISTGGRLHLLGLVGEGGVHSHTRHLLALVEAAAKREARRVVLHLFTDGRDTEPTSGLRFVRDVQDRCQRLGVGRVASICGRYYAMDRDHRWERTERAYRAIVQGQGRAFTSASAAIESAYRAGVTDEFIEPSLIVPPGAQPITIEAGDTLIFFNFRADRCRQLVEALTSSSFSAFDRPTGLHELLHVTTLTRYDEHLPVHVAFAPDDVVSPVGRVVADAGLRQFHVAETEKYPHVTYFVNGGREEPFPGEDRRLIPSPKVATYDLQPEMSAPAVAEATVDAIRSGDYDWIIVNFANCDMVGHTGSLEAAVTATETVDRCLGEVIDATLRADGVALVVADHGNCEEMRHPETGAVLTAHTTNPVPCILVSPETSRWRHVELRSGEVLASVAPTLLQLLGLALPDAMDRPSLIDRR